MMTKNPKKKILFMLPLLNAGGAERVLITLMSNVDRNKYDPVFVVLGDEGRVRDWIPDDIPFYALNKKSVSRSLYAFFKILRQIKPDIAITTMVHANALLALMKPFFPRTKFIIRESSTPSALMNEYYGRKGKLNLYVYRYLYRLPHLVISPAQSIIDDFQDKLCITMKNHKILYNPVDEEKIKKTLPQTFENNKNIVRFVAAGRLNFEKGFDRLISALGRTDFSGKWQLDILGDGPERDNLLSLIKKYNLENNVFLKGYQDAPWVTMAQGDLFLLSSRWEGMPNVALESLACGTPVLSMREAGGIVDVNMMTSNDTVQIVDTIEEFVIAMKETNPARKLKPAQSLLPKEFELGHIINNFEAMLDD